MSESDPDETGFGPTRRLLWPIHRHELKKFLPMFLIFFCIFFSYNILRTMKDTLVVTAHSSGAEVIPFIKVWVMFPGSLLMTFLFTCFSNRFSRETVFYIVMSIFLIYFTLFAFILYPLQNVIHPHALADRLQVSLPAGCKGFVAMFRNWSFTLFYGMSELWGNIILFVLFWGFANQVTNINEAKRFYGLLGFGANFSGILAGQVSVLLSRKVFNPHLPFGTTAWEQSMTSLIVLVILSGIFSLWLFRWFNQNVLNDPRYYDPKNAREGKEDRGKLSVRESLSYLLKSRYLLYLTLIVIAYNVVISLVELVWKDRVSELYPNPSDYSLYVNQISTIIGIAATFGSLLVSGNALRRFGWTSTAMLTPLILLVTSILFFGLFFFGETGFSSTFWGMTPLMLIVLAGSVQNIFSRAAKYTVFDVTKEVAFIPLTTECKIKGKAAIDGVCNRFGKSGGSFIHQSLLIAFSTFTASAPYVMAVLLLIIGVWMWIIRLLGKEFNRLTATAVKENEQSIQELSDSHLIIPTDDVVLTEQQAV